MGINNYEPKSFEDLLDSESEVKSEEVKTEVTSTEKEEQD